MLDALRGVAIAAVMLHHFAFYGRFEPQNAFDAGIGGLAAASWCGVDLFFVLSGFLITRILYQTKRAERFFSTFYLRRTLRIFPLYYATLLGFFVILPAVRITGLSVEGAGSEWWYWTYLVNVRIAWLGWPEAYAIAHFWSLAVEEQFYLAWPLLVFLHDRRQLVRICLALIVLAFCVRFALAWHGEALAAYVLTPARADALAAGSLLALGADFPGGLARWRKQAWAVLAVSAVGLASIILWKGRLWTDDFVTVTFGLTFLASLSAAALALAVTSSSRPLHQGPTSRALAILGRYSYALYVFHHPIAIAFGYRVMTIGDLPIVFGSSVPAFALYALVVGALSFGAALLSWYVLETPFLKLKNAIPYARPRGSNVAGSAGS